MAPNAVRQHFSQLAMAIVLKKEDFVKVPAGWQDLAINTISSDDCGEEQKYEESGVDLQPSPDEESLETYICALPIFAEEKSRYQETTQYEEQVDPAPPSSVEEY
jgi:hypothetical protein